MSTMALLEIHCSFVVLLFCFVSLHFSFKLYIV